MPIQMDYLDQLGESTSKKLFSISYICSMAETELSTHFFIQYLSNVKSLFADNSRAEPTIFYTEKLSFSLKLFSGRFYGQSCIKTV